MGTKRHKVFISYFHKDDQKYKNELLKQNRSYHLFEDFSVHEDEIDDTDMSSQQIRKIIRDEYIKDATVLILLCGKNTSKRKHIDWEIHAAMYNSNKNSQMGILVINLPGIKQAIRTTDEDQSLVSDDGNWISVPNRKKYEEYYPYMPIRIIDNFKKGVPITVVNWDRISNNPKVLKELIHNAYLRRKTNVYRNHRKMRPSNG